ncbi:MAG: anti-sigma factor antagonist [Clostridia bacterium]|nr:anti-sigma factor antagonist [Clostridia bacterium]
MDIKYKKSINSFTVFLEGEIDECSVSNVKDLLDKMILDNIDIKRVVFDLSNVSFMDSTGIGLLIGRYKKLKSLSIDSYIKGANIATEKVLELAGLYNIMPKF